MLWLCAPALALFGMPFHSQDEFRGPNKYGSRSKDSLREAFWRENPIMTQGHINGDRRSSFYIQYRRGMIPNKRKPRKDRNGYCRTGYLTWQDRAVPKACHKFYVGRDHYRGEKKIRTGNSQKKWILGGWDVDGTDNNFHKVRRNNRLYKQREAQRTCHVGDEIDTVLRTKPKPNYEALNRLNQQRVEARKEVHRQAHTYSYEVPHWQVFSLREMIKANEQRRARCGKYRQTIARLGLFGEDWVCNAILPDGQIWVTTMNHTRM